MLTFPYRITVTQKVSDENLTRPDDRIDNPSGTYDYDAISEKAALDEFHNHIAIGCLDDFEISVDLRPMSAQEVFETAARHIFAQGERSVNKYGDCMYRGHGGLACVVGTFIPEHRYNANMEELCAADVIKDFPGIGHLRGHEKMLNRLQDVHDLEPHWESDASMRDAIASVGGMFNLDAGFLSGLTFARAEA